MDCEGFPRWHWEIPEFFNIGVACTDAHLGTAVAGRAAMIVDDAASGVRQLTFAELAEQSSRFNQLLVDLGIRPGDRVLIRLPNCIEYPVVFLGAIKRGAIPVPTSVLLTRDEVLYLLRDSGARVLVTGAAALRELAGEIDGIEHILLVGEGARECSLPTARPLALALAALHVRSAAHPTRAEDPAYLVYTSGTTGYPKGVLHAQRALLGRQPSSTYWFDFLPAGDRVLHSGRLNWTYVLGTGMMDPLFRGHTAILREGPADAAAWIELIARHRATTFIGVPTLYRQILQKTAASAADVPTLRHCMCAGEHLSEELLAAWRTRFGLELYEGLGMTECSYYICQTRTRPVRAGSAGFIQPGHDVHLLDPLTWRDVAIGDEGVLCIPRSDPALMLGYWNQPRETALCFHDQWFVTGDYARRDEDGYIWFLGRRDDQIKSFGYRVSPHEVERVLKENPRVADAAVVGEEIEPGKVLVTAYVVLHPEESAATAADEILAFARQHLASYKVPRIVYVVGDLPRTRNGKLLRSALHPGAARARSRPGPA